MFVERDKQERYRDGQTQHHAEIDEDRARGESVESIYQQPERVHERVLAQNPRAV